MDTQEAYARSVAGWLDAVRGFDPGGEGAGDGPTPCRDWTVRDLVNHVVGEDRWTGPLMEGRTIADVGHDLDGDLLGEDPQASAEAAAAEALRAVEAHAPATATVHLSYGDEDAAEYLRQLTADHLVHGWDLRAATGQDRELDPEVLAAVAGWYADREELYRSAGAVGPRPEGVTGASAQDELLLAFGRDPGWSG